MAEPISTIALITALYPLLKNGIKSLGTSIGESAFGGPIEEVAGTLAKQGFGKLIGNLPQILESPENHDLLRAVRRSYLNATLVMCFARLQNINPSKFDVKNLILQVVPNKEEPGTILKILKSRLVSNDVEANKEIEWLVRAVDYLHSELANMSDWKVTGTFEEATKNVELMLKPQNAEAQIRDIQTKLKNELIAELASTADAQTFDTQEFIGKEHQARYGECLPPELLTSINRGWYLLKDDGSIFRQSAEQVNFEWFDVLSVFFAEEIKQPDSRAGKIFNAKMLADLKYQNGQPCNFSAPQFAEHLAEANKVIATSLENTKREVGEINQNVRLLLPLVTTIESVKLTVQLILDGVEKANRGVEKLQVGQEESIEISREILEAISHISVKKSLPKTIPFTDTFIGRKEILAELQKAYDGGARKFVLHGLGGVGKSRICLEFAKRNRNAYEAQVFIDMQGLSDRPRFASDAMLQVIRQFDPVIPIDESQIGNVYRNFVQQQPTMIVLDNAENLESVKTLCQANNVCILITSRNVLEDLKEVVRFKINQMSEDDARELLFSIAGEQRFEGKADELARLAGYLPIALEILASNLHTDDVETITGLIAKYKDTRTLFKDVEASFELSYKKLPDELKRCWRWLSISPSDFDLEAIKSIVGVSPDEAREIQKELRNRSLLEYNADTKRFKLHDLARKFADSKLDENAAEELKKLPFFKRLLISFQLWLAPEYAPQERLSASHSHADYYASIFTEAYEIKYNDPENGFINALNLIDTEWSNIIAGQKWAADFAKMHPEFAETCCRYSSFSEFLDLRMTPQEAIDWQAASVEAAKMLGNKKREGLYLGNMGVSYRQLGNYEKAIECHTRSLEIARQLKDEDGEASGLANLAIVYGSSGQYKKGMELLEPVLQMARQTNNRKRESLTLSSLGSFHTGLGDFRKAIELFIQSLKLAREIGDLHGESIILSNLANVYHDLGDSKKAREYDEQSLQITQRIGDKLGENLVLQNMNSPENFSTLEEFETAIKKFEELLQAARQNNNPLEEFRCLYQLGTIYSTLDVPPKAVEYLDLALTKARQIGDKEKELHCLGNLGTVFGMAGESELAIQICEEALQLAREIGDRSSEGFNLHKLGLGYASLGEMKKACAFWTEALKIFEAIGSPSAGMVRSLLLDAGCD